MNMQDSYMAWQTQQQQQSSPQQHSSYTPHSSTPPPSSIQLNQQSRLSSNNINSTSQFYDPNLIIPAHQLMQQQQKQYHPSMDTLAGQKLNNESILKEIKF